MASLTFLHFFLQLKLSGSSVAQVSFFQMDDVNRFVALKVPPHTATEVCLCSVKVI